ncbi:hypothetical protein KVA01_20890 [Kocuria varians]|uniref:Lipoprotein n=1 Tax=Kocuria varians TaxID=1272 RepID=A0A4Y4D897_KOCVA|nr:hypothetical protein KVA01_20890 [Kocuria varians]
MRHAPHTTVTPATVRDDTHPGCGAHSMDTTSGGTDMGNHTFKGKAAVSVAAIAALALSGCASVGGGGRQQGWR